MTQGSAAGRSLPKSNCLPDHALLPPHSLPPHPKHPFSRDVILLDPPNCWNEPEAPQALANNLQCLFWQIPCALPPFGKQDAMVEPLHAQERMRGRVGTWKTKKQKVTTGSPKWIARRVSTLDRKLEPQTIMGREHGRVATGTWLWSRPVLET